MMLKAAPERLMSGELMPALSLLQGKIADAKRKVNELVAAYNVIAVEAGQPLLPEMGGADSAAAARGAGSTLIKSDTFFGKKQQTAIREYLTMRKSAGLGPATPREIHDALKAGGYQYEAKTDEIAMVGLRALLRKRYTIFQRLPNGTYGLTSWYPDAKKPKGATAAPQTDDEDLDEAEDLETAAPQDEDPNEAAVA